jgi:lipopolysaccharide export system permease protein
VGVVLLIMAGELAIGNLAARHLALVPLIWIEAVAPGVICLWLLFAEPLFAWLGGSRVGHSRDDPRPT